MSSPHHVEFLPPTLVRPRRVEFLPPARQELRLDLGLLRCLRVPSPWTCLEELLHKLSQLKDDLRVHVDLQDLLLVTPSGLSLERRWLLCLKARWPDHVSLLLLVFSLEAVSVPKLALTFLSPRPELISRILFRPRRPAKTSPWEVPLPTWRSQEASLSLALPHHVEFLPPVLVRLRNVEFLPLAMSKWVDRKKLTTQLKPLLGDNRSLQPHLRTRGQA
jgi:hypothetical protein